MYQQESPLTFNTTTFIEKGILVTLDKATGVVTIAVDENVDGVTVGNSSNPDGSGVVSVASLKDIGKCFFVRLGASVAKGGGIIADAAGKGIPNGAETAVAYAKQSGVKGDLIGVYNF